MSTGSLERGPSQREARPELPTLDPVVQEQLERKFSKPFDDFHVKELIGEAYRLLQEAHRKPEAEQTEEDWEALWWFNRRAEQRIFEINGQQEWPGELEQMAQAYEHTDDAFVRDDLEGWYDHHRRPDMPATMTEFAELVGSVD